MLTRARYSFVLGLLSMACGAPAPDAEEAAELASDGVNSVEQAIRNGTATFERPEVGMLTLTYGDDGGIASGTLISSNVVLTCAHCVLNKRRVVFDGSTNFGTFTMFSEAGDELPPVEVAATYSFNPSYIFDTENDWPDDIGIVILKSAVPAATAIPATVRLEFPLWGSAPTVTHMGFGCVDNNDDCTGWGTKRFRTHTFGSGGHIGLDGDSGAPVFLGDLDDNGPIHAVHSAIESTWPFGWDEDLDARPLWFWERLLAFVRKNQFAFEVSVNYPGSDYESTTQDNAWDCATRCVDDSRCRAMTYVESTSKCWLKDAVPQYRTQSGRISLVVQGRDSVEYGFDRTGFVLSTAPAGPGTDCAKQCLKNSGCDAWTIQWGVGGLQCVLKFGKDSRPQRTSVWTHASGLRGGMDYFSDRSQDLSELSQPSDYLRLYYGCNYLYGTPLGCIYSERDCQAKCADSSLCEYWQYSWGGTTPSCTLYNIDPPSSTGTNSTVVSGLMSNFDKSNTVR